MSSCFHSSPRREVIILYSAEQNVSQYHDAIQIRALSFGVMMDASYVQDKYWGDRKTISKRHMFCRMRPEILSKRREEKEVKEERRLELSIRMSFVFRLVVW